MIQKITTERGTFSYRTYATLTHLGIGARLAAIEPR